MTPQLEAILFRTDQEAADFAADCRATFATEPGKRVMEALCAACVPMANPFTIHGDPMVIAGRQEVVSLLLRGSNLPITRATTPKPQD